MWLQRQYPRIQQIVFMTNPTTTTMKTNLNMVLRKIFECWTSFYLHILTKFSFLSSNRYVISNCCVFLTINCILLNFKFKTKAFCISTTISTQVHAIVLVRLIKYRKITANICLCKFYRNYMSVFIELFSFQEQKC